MSQENRTRFVLAIALSMGLLASPVAAATPIRLGYSDWPGWVAWQVAIDKGWLKQAGLDITFQWFEYSASIAAYSAGKIDGVMMTNGDALVTGAAGAKSVMIILTDYSDGNDMIVARPGISSLKDLKGKKIGIELGFVEHLMLLDGLAKNGMSEKDVTLVNIKTNSTPQALASGQVDAIGAWQPSSGLAISARPGSHSVYTSAQAPGLIYDVVAVSPASLAANKPAYVKLAKVWDRVVKYVDDPRTQGDAVRIMARRVGLSPDQYKPLLKGSHLINLAESRNIYKKGSGYASLYGSSKIADNFNTKYGAYGKAQDVNAYIDSSVTGAP